jgi:hypothetical protein
MVRLRKKIYVIDNSKVPLGDKVFNYDDQVVYFFNGENIGYGRAHNRVMKESIGNSKYHLVLNPDVYFLNGCIEKLYYFMEQNQNVGLLMPKVLNPDGSIQYLCKLLPKPLDLILRRFLPLGKIVDNRNKFYELRFTGYNSLMEVPYLSGCFMFIRTEVLAQVGLFDERFFMYLEDTDLSRRIHGHFRTVYYPGASIYHEYEKGSYKSIKLMMYHIVSAIKYFNKWGWFFDRERREINRRTLEKLGYYDNCP